MSHLLKNDNITEIGGFLEGYLKNKSKDCILYSSDGAEFKVHKEVLGQTKFMREILKSIKDQCCGEIEIICPCSMEDLQKVVHFMYYGEIHCKDVYDSFKLQEDLKMMFGFPEILNIDDQIASLLRDPSTSSILNNTLELFIEESAKKLPTDIITFLNTIDSNDNHSERDDEHATGRIEPIEYLASNNKASENLHDDSNTKPQINAENNSNALSDYNDDAQENKQKAHLDINTRVNEAVDNIFRTLALSNKVDETEKPNREVNKSLSKQRKDQGTLTKAVDKIQPKIEMKPYSRKFCKRSRENRTSLEQHVKKVEADANKSHKAHH